MMGGRRLTATLVMLALATAMHLDWHAARPATHHLSLGWRWHWLLAVPVFALTAFYVRRAWSDRLIAASVAIIGSAGILAALVEPAWEYWVGGTTFDWAFGPLRLATFAAFLATGVLTYAIVLGVAKPRALVPRD